MMTWEKCVLEKKKEKFKKLFNVFNGKVRLKIRTLYSKEIRMCGKSDNKKQIIQLFIKYTKHRRNA